MQAVGETNNRGVATSFASGFPGGTCLVPVRMLVVVTGDCQNQDAGLDIDLWVDPAGLF